MINDIKGVSLRRVMEIFLSYDPLSFYKQPFHDLDDSIPKNFTKCQAFEGDDHLPEKSRNVFDYISKKYGLEKEPERREIFSLIASLELVREGLQNFFHKAERIQLPAGAKGDIFLLYLRLCIKDICFFVRHLNSRK